MNHPLPVPAPSRKRRIIYEVSRNGTRNLLFLVVNRMVIALAASTIQHLWKRYRHMQDHRRRIQTIRSCACIRIQTYCRMCFGRVAFLAWRHEQLKKLEVAQKRKLEEEESARQILMLEKAQQRRRDEAGERIMAVVRTSLLARSRREMEERDLAEREQQQKILRRIYRSSVVQRLQRVVRSHLRLVIRMRVREGAIRTLQAFWREHKVRMMSVATMQNIVRRFSQRRRFRSRRQRLLHRSAGRIQRWWTTKSVFPRIYASSKKNNASSTKSCTMGATTGVIVRPLDVDVLKNVTAPAEIISSSRSGNFKNVSCVKIICSSDSTSMPNSSMNTTYSILLMEQIASVRIQRSVRTYPARRNFLASLCVAKSMFRLNKNMQRSRYRKHIVKSVVRIQSFIRFILCQNHIERMLDIKFKLLQDMTVKFLNKHIKSICDNFTGDESFWKVKYAELHEEAKMRFRQCSL